MGFMITSHGYIFSVRVKTLDQLRRLQQIEDLVPGARVYVIERYRSMKRLSRWLPTVAAEASPTVSTVGAAPTAPAARIEVQVATHGGWLVAHWLEVMGLSFDLVDQRAWRTAAVWPSSLDREEATSWPLSDEGRARLVEEGRAILRRIIDSGLAPAELTSGVPLERFVLPFQYMTLAWMASRPWSLLRASPGAGKTLCGVYGSLAWCLASSGRAEAFPNGSGHARLGAATAPGRGVRARLGAGGVLVLCPARARKAWRDQVPQYSLLEPFELKPCGERRRKDEPLSDYLQRQREVGKPPMVIAGWESLPDYEGELASSGFQPTAVLYDELHLMGDRRRWRVTVDEDGQVAFERQRTGAGRLRRAATLMDISRWPSVNVRIGLTATPLGDGRPRRLWAQFDLLDPLAFGSYWSFAKRYAGAYDDGYGMQDGGAENLDELHTRARWFLIDIPHRMSHGDLPPLRVEVVRLPVHEQDQTREFHAELKSLRALALGRKSHRSFDDFEVGEAVGSASSSADDRAVGDVATEIKLAEACSRKRSYVLAEVSEALRAGLKVVLFTGRRSEAELWAGKVRSEVNRIWATKDTRPERPEPKIWWAHGGVSERDRDTIVDEYVHWDTSNGGCCLVATGQSMGTSYDGFQATDLAIFAMLPWGADDFVQWAGRFDRQGGTSTLLKIVVAEDTFDERVVEVLTEKFGVVERLFDAEEVRRMGSALTEAEEDIGRDILSKLGLAEE